MKPSLFQRNARLQSKSYGRKAFSLIEIVIALAVVTFCLVPIIGLLGIASQEGQAAEGLTDLALVLQSQQAILGAENFDSLTNQINAASPPTPSQTYYYASGGRYLGTNSTRASWPTNTLYRCTIVKTTVATTDDRAFCQLLVEYPAPGFKKNKTFPLSFFRYGPR